MSATKKATSSASGKAHHRAAPETQSPQTKAIRARWDGENKSDEEVRQFFSTCEHGDGLEALKTLRRQVEIAARAYDENVHKDDQEICANPNCRKKLGPNAAPYHKLSVKDPQTNVYRNVMSCSMPCYLIVHGKDGNHPITRH